MQPTLLTDIARHC